jgi:hypothetical protein
MVENWEPYQLYKLQYSGTAGIVFFIKGFNFGINSIWILDPKKSSINLKIIYLIIFLTVKHNFSQVFIWLKLKLCLLLFNLVWGSVVLVL